jgi:hypothetical protein
MELVTHCGAYVAQWHGSIWVGDGWALSQVTVPVWNRSLTSVIQAWKELLNLSLNRGSHSLRLSRVSICTKYPHGCNGQEDGLGKKTNKKETESGRFIHSNHALECTILSLQVAPFYTLLMLEFDPANSWWQGHNLPTAW